MRGGGLQDRRAFLGGQALDGGAGRGRRVQLSPADCGVDVTPCLIAPEETTGSYLGILYPDGRLHFAAYDMRVISALQPAFIQKFAPLFEDAGLVFVDANVPPATLSAIYHLAGQLHIPVCADPTSTALAPRLEPFLDRTYLITPNFSEAAVICHLPAKPAGEDVAVQTARELVGRGVEIAILSIGELGVCYASSETSGRIPAIQTMISDPTGAGDALTAAVIFALLNNIPLDDAVRLGVSAASLTLHHKGTVVPDLTLEKLYDHLVI